jgi:predicted acetyltransferase
MEELVYSTLNDKPHLAHKTVELIERCFNYNSEQHYNIDFYPLINSRNFLNCHIILGKNEEVIGHIGVSPRSLLNHESKFPVILMGGICIDSKFRGKGILHKFMEHVISQYQKTTFYILWSNLSSLYEKFQFYPAGGQIQTGNSDDLKNLYEHFEKTKFSKLNEAEKKEIRLIYNENICATFTSLDRSENDWLNIEGIKSTNLYIKKNNNIISSYFFINKGMDLTNIIHEWGAIESERENILTILQEYKLWVPEKTFRQEKYTELNFIALFKIGNIEIFNSFVQSWSNEDVKILKVQNNLVTFQHLSKQYELDSAGFLVSMFGPNCVKEFDHYGPPLYFSGLDSI